MLSDEQQAFAEAIRDFCAREDFPRGEAHDAGVYAKLAELGWLGVVVPEEYGGSGGGALDMVVLLDELGAGNAPVNGIGTTFIVAGAYGRFGSEEQKQAMLGGIAGGAVEAIAMSEPGAGSDVGALTCRAERSGTQSPSGSSTAAATSSTGRRRGSPTPTSPTTRCWSPGPRATAPSTRA